MTSVQFEVSRAITKGDLSYVRQGSVEEWNQLVRFLVAIRTHLTAEGLENLAVLQQSVYVQSLALAEASTEAAS